jgi:hypothetical protein
VSFASAAARLAANSMKVKSNIVGKLEDIGCLCFIIFMGKHHSQIRADTMIRN